MGDMFASLGKCHEASSMVSNAMALQKHKAHQANCCMLKIGRRLF